MVEMAVQVGRPVFMSDRSARPKVLAAAGKALIPAAGERANQEATAEVRAILSATEPLQIAEGFKDYHGGSDMRVTVLTRDYAAYAVAVEALAEALATFIEEA